MCQVNASSLDPKVQAEATAEREADALARLEELVGRPVEGEPDRLTLKRLELSAYAARLAAAHAGEWRLEPVARAGRYPRAAVLRALAGKPGRPGRPNDSLYTSRAARAARRTRCEAERLARAARRLTEQAGASALMEALTHSAA